MLSSNFFSQRLAQERQTEESKLRESEMRVRALKVCIRKLAEELHDINRLSREHSVEAEAHRYGCLNMKNRSTRF